MSSREDGRENDQLRRLEIVPNYARHAEGSAFIKMGQTWVLCTASIAPQVPKFLLGQGVGWLTAEYAMLPRSTHTRTSRQPGGRGKEIQRLIGRSLRAAINLDALGERTVTIDCDVIQADGGTRVASITGGYVALALAVETMIRQGAFPRGAKVLREPIAAISVGIVDGQMRLDLPYVEDSRADVDMNVVMTESGNIVEIQGTAEKQTFSKEQAGQLLELAASGVSQLCRLQRQIIEETRQ